jgi:hypothetical protein
MLQNVIQHNPAALATLADDADLDREGSSRPKHATIQALQGWKVQGIKVHMTSYAKELNQLFVTTCGSRLVKLILAAVQGGGDLATFISVVGACDHGRWCRC